MRTVDVYYVKKYEVSEAMMNGALELANWYRQEGNVDKANHIVSLVASVEGSRLAEGKVWGMLKAYSNRVAKLATAA